MLCRSLVCPDLSVKAELIETAWFLEEIQGGNITGRQEHELCGFETSHRSEEANPSRSAEPKQCRTRWYSILKNNH